MVNFTTVACRVSSRLKWCKNYKKNRLRLAKVIVNTKMSRFYGSLCTFIKKYTKFGVTLFSNQYLVTYLPTYWRCRVTFLKWHYHFLLICFKLVRPNFYDDELLLYDDDWISLFGAQKNGCPCSLCDELTCSAPTPEADLGMFSMFGRTGAHKNRGPANFCNIAKCRK